MSQREAVLISNAPVQTVAGTKYKGRVPQYTMVTDPVTNLTQYVKVSKGIPFVRVQ